MKKIFLYLIAITLFSACSDNKPQHIYLKDYEQSFGWEKIPVVKGNAHSGSYAEAITPNREFSVTFESGFSQIETAYPLPKITAIVWLNASKLLQPVYLVLHVTDPADGRSVEYKSVELKQQDANGKWFPLILVHTLSEGIRGNYLCKIYVWNPNKQNLLADDFQITFEK